MWFRIAGHPLTRRLAFCLPIPHANVRLKCPWARYRTPTAVSDGLWRLCRHCIKDVWSTSAAQRCPVWMCAGMGGWQNCTVKSFEWSSGLEKSYQIYFVGHLSKEGWFVFSWLVLKKSIFFNYHPYNFFKKRGSTRKNFPQGIPDKT